MIKHTILICANSYPPNFIGGAELVAHNQAKALRDKGHTVIVFAGENCSNRPRHAVIEEQYEGLKIYRIKLTYENFDANFVNFKNQEIDEIFRDIIDKHKPDIAHFHNIIGLSLGMIEVAKEENIRTVLSIHDHWGYCYKNTIIKSENALCEDATKCYECMPYITNYGNNIPISIRKDYFGYIMTKVDAFISSSKYFIECYEKNGVANNIHNIWNGIEVKKLDKIANERYELPNKIRFTYIGYFGKHKGVKGLLEAFEKLENKDNVVVNLVGSGDQEEAYRLYIDKHNLKSYVKFWGRIPYNEMARVHRETDVYVLPSIWPENQPLSLTEGMGAGIPAIASRRGGNLEIIEDGIDGFLFDPENVYELVEKMNILINDRDKLHEMGKKAKLKMSSKSFANQVDEIIDVYNSVNKSKISGRDDKVLISIMAKKMAAEYVDSFNNMKRDIAEIIMHEWLSLESISKVEILVVMESNIRIEDIVKYLVNGACLVVNESNRELTSLIRKINGGLYFSEYRDFEKEVEWLLNNPDMRVKMQNNILEYMRLNSL